jgi:uncharacterized coiled-coil DUF342 family protein
MDIEQAVQQQKQQYVQKTLSEYSSKPEDLSKEERRLCKKYQEEANKLGQLHGEISQLRDQLRQGEARLKSLELQAADSQGRASGLLDYLISSKFDEESPVVPSVKKEYKK